MLIIKCYNKLVSSKIYLNQNFGLKSYFGSNFYCILIRVLSIKGEKVSVLVARVLGNSGHECYVFNMKNLSSMVLTLLFACIGVERVKDIPCQVLRRGGKKIFM